jgi:ankyrin repeat protein
MAQLFSAVLKNDLKAVEDYCTSSTLRNKNLNFISADGRVPIWAAAEMGYSEVFECLLRNNARVDQPDNDGNTPLHLASNLGYFHYVRRLLSKYKTDVDVGNVGGYTALHLAVEEGSVEVVKLLIQKKANPNKPSNDGTTPFMLSKGPVKDYLSGLVEKLPPLDKSAVNAKSKQSLVTE